MEKNSQNGGKKGPYVVRKAEAASPAEELASLRDQTYTLLKRMIDDGRLQPGERIMEAQLVKAFGVSRSPARRALQMLRDEQLILEHGKRGYKVAGHPTRSGGPMAALDPVRLSQPRQWERVYSKVEQELYAHLLYGSVRINEVRLAQHFNVSRSVTRDVLARMHGLGLIVKDGAGHWIAEKMTPLRIQHLYEMRQLLEPAALLQAAPHIPAPSLKRARSNVLAALSTRPIDSGRFDQVESDLHLDFLSFSPNVEILHALRRTHLLFGPTRHLIDPVLEIPMPMIEAAADEHLEVIDLLQGGKADQAAEVLRRHLTDAVDRWLLRFETTARIPRIEFPPYLAPSTGNAAIVPTVTLASRA